MDRYKTGERDNQECNPVCFGIFNNDPCASDTIYNSRAFYCRYDDNKLYYDDTISTGNHQGAWKMGVAHQPYERGKTMKRWFNILILTLLTFTLNPILLHAEDAAEIIKKSQDAFFAQGKDMQARAKMTLVSKPGQQRLRELTLLRKNRASGLQKYLMYFHNPGDVR